VAAIAHQIRRTTPDVQAYLADVVIPTPVPLRRAAGSLIAPGLPPIDRGVIEPANVE